MSAQKLGAVGLVLLGVWWAFGSLAWAAESVDFYWRSGPVTTASVLAHLGQCAFGLAIGVTLILLASKLARWFLPVEDVAHGPGMREILSPAIAALAVYLILDRGNYVIRLVLPFFHAAEDRHEGILVPWVELGTIALAALGFWYSHEIAHFWCKRRGNGAHA